MMITRKNPSPDRQSQRLLALFRALDEAGRRSLLDFAEFLSQRAGDAAEDGAAEDGATEDGAVPPPRDIPRPAEESVVRAIRRLAETYPMLDRGAMLNETSALMAQHVMQGRPAAEVIDELEALFRRHYDALTATDS